MGIYFALLFIPIYTYLCCKLIKNKKFMMFLPYVFLILFAGLRNGIIGADYKNYIAFFRGYMRYGEMPYGWGWRLVNALVGFFTSDYHYLGIVTALVVISLFFYVMEKNVSTNYWWLCLLVYIFNPYLYIQGNFNIMRQGIAMAVILYVFTRYLNKKSLFWFIVGTAIASCFHTSALFMLMIIFFMKYPLTKKFHYIMAVITFVLSIIITDSRIIGLIARYTAYGKYINSQDVTLFNFTAYKLFIFLTTLLLCYLYDNLFDNKDEKMCTDIYIFSLCILNLLLINDIAYRIYLYFAIMHTVFLPIILGNISKKRNDRYLNLAIHVTVVAYYIMYFVVFIYIMAASHNTSYIPYILWE